MELIIHKRIRKIFKKKLKNEIQYWNKIKPKIVEFYRLPVFHAKKVNIMNWVIYNYFQSCNISSWSLDDFEKLMNFRSQSIGGDSKDITHHELMLMWFHQFPDPGQFATLEFIKRHMAFIGAVIYISAQYGCSINCDIIFMLNLIWTCAQCCTRISGKIIRLSSLIAVHFHISLLWWGQGETSLTFVL